MTGFTAQFATSIGNRRVGSFSRLLMAASAIIFGSLEAKAASSYTFNPSAPDLNDLDHHYAYMWVLSGLDTSQTYTSASLTITNINNWDLTKNILFIHLFDTASTSPSGGATVVGSGNNIVTSFTDAVGTPVTDLSDAFGPTSLSINPLVKQTNTTNIMLGTYVDGSFSGPGTLIDGVSVPNYQNGVFTPPSSPNQPETVTYNFNASQLVALNNYIQGGDVGRIAFGLDSDCHFFNDGVQFTMSSGGPQPVIPEPATTLAGIACVVPILGSIFGRRRRS